MTAVIAPHRLKISFVCDLEEGIHWKLYLDNVWKGDFLHLEAAIDHIYSITGKEIWGDRLIRYEKKRQTLEVPKAPDP